MFVYKMEGKTINMKLYEEKNFLANRDIEAYKTKQAGSCLWLIERLRKYKTNEDECWYLINIHEDQYEMIGIKTEKPTKSFYFDTILDRLGKVSDEEKLYVHCVSYFRGLQRYEQLKEFDKGCELWYKLAIDAKTNGILLQDALELSDDQKEKIITIEEEVVREIDLNKRLVTAN